MPVAAFWTTSELRMKKLIRHCQDYHIDRLVIRSRGATELQDLLLVLLSHAKFGQNSQKNREIIHFSKPQLINQVTINI